MRYHFTPIRLAKYKGYEQVLMNMGGNECSSTSVGKEIWQYLVKYAYI